MRHKHSKPDGNQIHVAINDDFKPGEKTVLYVPGYHGTFDARPNSQIMKALEQWCGDNATNFVSFEYTAHGASDGDMRQAGLRQFLRDTQFIYDTFCNSEKSGPVTIVGHSIGGWFAPIVAARAARKDPESIDGIVSLAPTLSLMGPNGYATQILKAPDARFDDEGAIFSPLGEATNMVYTPDIFLRDARILDLIHKHRRIGHNGSSSFIMEPLPTIPPQPFKMVFIHGNDDPAAPKSDIEAYVARLSDGNWEIVTRYAEPHPSGNRDRPAGHGMARASDLAVILEHTASFVENGPRLPRTRAPYASEQLTL